MRISQAWRWLTCAIVCAVLLGGSAWAQAILPRDVRERILQAVVQVAPLDPSTGRLVGTAGSGTVVSPDGFVLTNFHVVADEQTNRAYEWHAIFTTDPRAPDREPAHSYYARYVAGDPRLDLAIVQIVEDAQERPLPADFVFLSMPVGDSNSLIPGDPITVVGYPEISGTTITFTTGVVSGFLGEDLTAGGKQWIKTDAKLGRGNSGGAAFDEYGVLVGIPTLRRTMMEERYVEQQDYLRPVNLAWPLLTAHVANVNRAGGVGSQVAAVPAIAVPSGPPTAVPSAPPTAAPGTTPPLTPVPLPPAGATPTPAPPVAQPSAPAFAVLTERGTLGPGAATLPSGEYFVEHEVRLDAGVPVTFELSSSAFDAYLLVHDPNGARVLEVDDSPGHGSDVVEAYLPEAGGTYAVVVTTYAPGESGDYLLRVTGAGATGAAPPPETSPMPPAAGGAPLLFERGQLSHADFTLDDGEYVDVFSLSLTPGTPLWVTLSSTEFDAYLVVLGPDERVVLLVDDSPGHGLDVSTAFVPPDAGDYLFAVTSAYPGETGAYLLTVTEGGATGDAGTPATAGTTPAAVGAGSGLVGPLALGAQARAELAGVRQGVAYHTYVVDVPTGAAQLVIEMAADADLDLFLKHGSEIVSLGDDGDWDYRDIDVAPRASFTVAQPAPGRWFVDVVWFDGGDATARYTLRAR